MGDGKDLSVLQMSLRAMLVFVIALVLIRVSGRRSFGLHAPLDNIIVILLGAILSRAVVGASPFGPVIGATVIIVVMHRLFGLVISRHSRLARGIEGEKIGLYENGRFIHENMSRCMVSPEDIAYAVRKALQQDDLYSVKRIYMESNGEITVVKDN